LPIAAAAATTADAASRAPPGGFCGATGASVSLRGLGAHF